MSIALKRPARCLVVVVSLLLLLPALANAEGEVTITSPTEGQTVQPYPTFTGTARADGYTVMVTLSGPTDFTNGTEVKPDGTWSINPPDALKSGSYTLAACQQQAMGPAICATQVNFTVGAGGGLIVTAPKGSIGDLIDGKLIMPVECPDSCQVKATVSVSDANARRLGIPFHATHPIIGAYDDQVFNGKVRLGLPEMIKPGPYDVGGYLNSSLRLPLFTSLPVTIKVRAAWGSESAEKTITTKLAWPKVAAATGRGSNGMIGKMTGPAKVSLSSKTATFRFKLSNVTDDLLFVSFNSAGGLLHLQGKYHLYGKSTGNLGPTATYKNGVFVLKIPIAGGGREGAKSRKNAGKVAPFPAFLQLAIGDKFGKGRRDTASLEVQLVR